MTKQKIRTTGEVLNDRSIVELIYDPEKDKTQFLVGNEDKQTICDFLKTDTKHYLPYKESNTLIRNKVVLLPSKPLDYGSIPTLVDELIEYIHKYVDLDPVFEKVCAHYILLSWVYDGFNQLPYLRKCGDFGTGKTRFLTVVGSVCYKPIFASGSSSTAAIFHTLDQFRGTFVFDEADFRYSDEKADLSKVLNNGFSKGYPVLRCSFSKNKEFDPIGYQVYGCKILASRKHFDDQALESRFITQQSTYSKLRSNIPNELPSSFDGKALELRNKLLQYRFNMLNAFSKYKTDCKIEGVEPRINQIFSPLLQIAVDEKFKTELLALAKQCSGQIVKDRATSIEYHTLSAIKFLFSERETVSVGDVSSYMFLQYSDFHDKKITARLIGSVINKILCLQTYKHSGRFYISKKQQELLDTLYLRYGVD